MSARKRVLVAEDSQTQRQLFARCLGGRPELVVVGQASDGEEAVRLVEDLAPDVVLMDLRMPRMDGLEATRRIMERRPTPILLMSAADNLDSEVGLGMEALAAGALDLIPKPDLGRLEGEAGEELVRRLVLLAGVPVIAHPGTGLNRLADRSRRRRSTAYFRRARRVVGIVASTGGPRALQEVLGNLPAGFRAAVVVVQHLDDAFAEGLVRWLDEHCPLPVTLAGDDQELFEGAAYLCPPGRYAELTERRCLHLYTAPVPRGGHCPSGDRLLSSLAQHYGARGIGVVLTGMGDDGAAGLCALRQAGGRTIAQDEGSSVIYGMPREAARRGGAARVLPLGDIAAALSEMVGA
ncbi:MAG: chemotaxis-specific protein-glutamate methyltransferase CheB [Planctomycetota bacterium]|nr:MAG: chemotaxis-specific protein-glutamate methyltransferase CheB [Planctomycetota bacterium]